MSPQRRGFLGALAVLGIAPGRAGARTFQVDDTGTVVSQPVLPMKWRQLVPGRGADHTVEATYRADVRLNLAPWLNQHCRIFMTLAPTREVPVRARWVTQGRLLPASVMSGGRVLVYEGPAAPAQFTESMLVTLEADGRQLSQAQSLSFQFEIELP